ncbi:MAG: hypothetical protein WCI30_07245 [Clostridia bacterium]
MNIKKVRGIVSSILMVSGMLSFITGAILFFTKYGMWLFFTRKLINDTHAISALIMGMALIVHLIINRRIYKVEINELLSRKTVFKGGEGELFEREE